MVSLVQAFLASFSGDTQAVSLYEYQGEVEAVICSGRVWQVWYRATLWTAESPIWLDLQPGDPVKVIDRHNLTLIIELWTVAR